MTDHTQSPDEGSPAHIMHLDRMVELGQLAASLFAHASAEEGARMQQQVDAAKIYLTTLRVKATRATAWPEQPSATPAPPPPPPAPPPPAPPPPPAAPEAKPLDQVFEDMSRVFDAVGPLFSALRSLGKK